METYQSDVVAEVYDLLSPYPIALQLPHVKLLDPSGRLLCTVMSVRRSFARVWFCNVLADFTARKAVKLSLLERVEIRDNGDLFFYPVSLATYKTLVPAAPLHSGKHYDNVKTVTVRLD
jgi:hypothetical protein